MGPDPWNRRRDGHALVFVQLRTAQRDVRWSRPSAHIPMPVLRLPAADGQRVQRASATSGRTRDDRRPIDDVDGSQRQQHAGQSLRRHGGYLSLLPRVRFDLVLGDLQRSRHLRCGGRRLHRSDVSAADDLRVRGIRRSMGDERLGAADAALRTRRNVSRRATSVTHAERVWSIHTMCVMRFESRTSTMYGPRRSPRDREG